VWVGLRLRATDLIRSVREAVLILREIVLRSACVAMQRTGRRCGDFARNPQEWLNLRGEHPYTSR
jgi:hypothetical protein